MIGSNPDEDIEIDRKRLRFNGIGPRLHGQLGQIWPRDSLNPNDECRKIFHEGVLKSMRNDDARLFPAREFVRKLLEALRQSDLHRLFDNICRLDNCYFNSRSFNLINAQEAFTRTKQVLSFIDRALGNINRLKKDLKTTNVVRYLFGTYKNRDIFRSNIKWLVIGNSRLRRQTISNFLECGEASMDVEQVIWLKEVPTEIRRGLFVQVIYALIRFITELIRRYFYITISNPYGHKLFYFRYDLWQKIQYHAIKRLIDDDILFPFCLDDSVRLEENSTSKIKFHLKMDGLRLICTRFKDNNKKKPIHQMKAVLHHVLSRTENFDWFRLDDLMMGLKQFKEKSSNKRLYFIKADLKDCFQSIPQDELLSIINTCLRSDFENDELKFYKFECTRKRLKGKSRRIVRKWTLDPESIRTNGDYEYTEQIGQPELMTIDELNQQLLRPHIINPVLRISRTSKVGYNLVKGIRQGCPYSPLLCSIYLQSAINKYLSDICLSDDCRIFRHVDDLLFITLDVEKGRQFMSRMQVDFKDSGLSINVDTKFECNFNFEGCMSSGRPTTHINFFRRIIAIDSLNCSHKYDYKGVTLEHTFNVNPHMDEIKIKRAMGKLSKIEFIHLDCDLNQADQVISNIFEHALLAAHRAATLIICSFKLKNLKQQNHKLVIELMDFITERINISIRNGSEKGLIKNDLNTLEVHLIVIAAFMETWKRDKLRHRKLELKRIIREWRAHWLPYLKRVENVDTSSQRNGLSVHTKIIELKDAFPNSDFARKVLLPYR